MLYSYDFWQVLRQSTLISTKLPYEYDVNYFQKLMSKSLTLKDVSIYSLVNNTREGVLFFYKAWWRVLVSIRIFEYFRGRIFESTFFQRIPALVMAAYRGWMASSHLQADCLYTSLGPPVRATTHATMLCSAGTSGDQGAWPPTRKKLAPWAGLYPWFFLMYHSLCVP